MARPGTRPSRAGNRRMNHVLHIAAVVQIRHDTEDRAFYRRKLTDGKTPLDGVGVGRDKAKPRSAHEFDAGRTCRWPP